MSDSNSYSHLALLRGINVGGNNIIKMADLRAFMESIGFPTVKTYIQSGNVLFHAEETDMEKLTEDLEKGLSEEFDYNSKIVLVTQKHLASVVQDAPGSFGEEPDDYRYDVLFLKEPLTPEEAMESITVREGVDRAWQGEGVLYFSRRKSRAGQSYLNKLVGKPVYKQMTIRNWNTTTRLHSLMAE
ncbi:MAG: DUF1697 domain-containing protein [Balneolaceae bacterium]